MPTKLLATGIILGFLLLTVVILTDSMASPGEEAVHAFNQHNLYYEWEFQNNHK